MPQAGRDMLERLVHPARQVPGVRMRAPGGLRARVGMPDQRLAGQVGLGDLILAGQSSGRGQHRHPRLGVQRGDAQAGLVDGQPHVADVDAAVEQHRCLVVPFDPLHVHQNVRVPGGEQPYRRGDCE